METLKITAKALVFLALVGGVVALSIPSAHATAITCVDTPDQGDSE